jgi:penicillin G amidase
MHALQADVYAAPTHLFAQAAVKMAAAHTDDARWQELRQELANWDGHLTIESRAGAIAAALRNQFMERFFTAWLGDDRKIYQWYRRSGVIDHAITAQPADWLPKQYQNYDAMVLECYQLAMQKLTEKLGAERARWQYGAINEVVFAHPLAKVSALKWLLNPATLPAPGSPHCVNAVDVNAKQLWGPTMRLVVSLADFNATTMSVVPGECAQPASPFYADQLPDWLAVRAHAFPFKNSDAAIHKLTLAPAK